MAPVGLRRDGIQNHAIKTSTHEAQFGRREVGEVGKNARKVRGLHAATNVEAMESNSNCAEG